MEKNLKKDIFMYNSHFAVWQKLTHCEKERKKGGNPIHKPIICPGLEGSAEFVPGL